MCRAPSLTKPHVISQDATEASRLAQPQDAVEHELHALPLVRPQPTRQQRVHVDGFAGSPLWWPPQHQRLPRWRAAVL